MCGFGGSQHVDFNALAVPMKLVFLVAVFIVMASGPAVSRFASGAQALDGAPGTAPWLLALFAISLGAALSLTLRPPYWRGFSVTATFLGLLFIIAGVLQSVPESLLLILGSCCLVCVGATTALWLRAEVFHVSWKR